jgi:uncharacterized protein with HEPN domain
MPNQSTARDNAALLDIDVTARRIMAFVRGRDHAAFLQDPLIQSAVLYQVAIIGEAVKRLSSDFRRDHSELPWRRAAGMRDRLIHGYDEVDLDQGWRTVTEEIPAFQRGIASLLPKPLASDSARDPSL